MWKLYANSIISASEFFSNFKTVKDFNAFVKNFRFNKYSKIALPVLLEKEIYGMGFALACNFLKEIGYSEYAKPDVHLMDIFYDLKLVKEKNQYEVFKEIIEMSKVVKKSPFYVDKVFWMICSGRFTDDKKVKKGKKELLKKN